MRLSYRTRPGRKSRAAETALTQRAERDLPMAWKHLRKPKNTTWLTQH